MDEAQYQQGSQPVFQAPENESSILRFQLDVENTLENIRMMLMGITPDYKNKKYKQGTPLLCEEYCDRVMEKVKSFLNKEAILSGFTDMDIYNLITNGIGKDLNYYLLSICMKKGSIHDKETFNMVIGNILNYCYASMKRAKDYKTLIHTGRAEIKEFNNPNQPDYGQMPMIPQQRGGFFK